MKNIFNLNDTLTNKISFYHLVLFLAALPFDQFYSEVVLVSFVLHTIIHAKWNVRFLWRKEFMLLISVFLVTVVFTVFSNNSEEAVRLWVRQLSIFIFPACFFLNGLDYRKYAKALFMIFSIVCTAVVCYLYLDALRIIYYYHLPATSLLSPSFMNHSFSEPLDIHATYLALYVYMSLVILVHYIFAERKMPLRFLYIICSMILLAALIQLGSRAVLISFLFTACFVFPLQIKKGKRLRFALMALSLTVLVLLTILKMESLRTRYLHGLQNDLTKSPIKNSVIDSRMERWSVAIDLIKKAPLIGHGTGDEVDLLKDRYFAHKLYDAYLNKLNAHNQYLSFLLTSGIIGLAVYLATLYWGLTLAIRSKNILFLSFLILLVFVSVSENLLERNKGIFFYGFFFSFFVVTETNILKTLQSFRRITKPGNPKDSTYVYTNEY